MSRKDEIHGIYKILEETDQKSKDGHMLFRVQCIICGKEFLKQANQFLYGNQKTECHHLTADERWKLEKHFCKKCGKMMTEKFGSGDFCSRACANSRERTDELKQKLSEKLSGKLAYWDSNKKVKYFSANEPIPEGYEKTYTTRTQTHTAKIRQENCREKILSEKKLLQKLMPNIQQHNKIILQQYEQLLSDLSENKTFTVEHQFLFAKYYAVINSSHPRAKERHVFVHVLLAETLLGRGLSPSEIVHHKDLNKLNNTFDNIYIFDSKASHARFHFAPFYWLEISDVNTLICRKVDKAFLLQLNNDISTE